MREKYRRLLIYTREVREYLEDVRGLSREAAEGMPADDPGKAVVAEYRDWIEGAIRDTDLRLDQLESLMSQAPE